MKNLIVLNILIISLLGNVAKAQPQQDDFMIPEEAGAQQVPAPGVDTSGQNPIDPSYVPDMNNVESSVTVPQGTDPLLEGFFEDANYSPQDKRDPFFPYLLLQRTKLVNTQEVLPTEPLQKFALNELKIVGIIWDVGKPKALILDPGGKSHIVVENTKLGKESGYIAAIREGEVLVVEEVYDPNGKKSYVTKILKLSIGLQSASAQ